MYLVDQKLSSTTVLMFHLMLLKIVFVFYFENVYKKSGSSISIWEKWIVR